MLFVQADGDDKHWGLLLLAAAAGGAPTGMLDAGRLGRHALALRELHGPGPGRRGGWEKRKGLEERRAGW